MKRHEITLLGYALLGLLHNKPSSGYELRKIFTETPLGGYSDSPGAIYPALRRLVERKLAQGSVVGGPGLRQRNVLSLTAEGETELKKWLTQPVKRAEVSGKLPELMLRFAFLEGVAGPCETIRFLESFAAEVRLYLPEIKEFLKSRAAHYPVAGRLALENGILGYEAQLTWATQAMDAYRNGENAR